MTNTDDIIAWGCRAPRPAAADASSRRESRPTQIASQHSTELCKFSNQLTRVSSTYRVHRKDFLLAYRLLMFSWKKYLEKAETRK